MKKTLKFLVMVLMVVALTGCMKINMNIEVQSDLTTKMSLELLVDEKLLSAQGEDPDTAIKQMQEEMLSEDQFKDAKVDTIEKTIDGAKWRGVSISGIAKNDGDSARVEKKTVDGKEQISLTLPMDNLSDDFDPSSMASAGYSVDQMKKLGMEMNVTIKMPGKASSNIGEVKDNTVTIDLLEVMVNGKGQDIVVTSDISSGGPNMALIIGVVAAIVVIIGAVIFMKKKKQPVEDTEVLATVPAEENTPENPQEETLEVEQEKVEDVQQENVEEIQQENIEEVEQEKVEEIQQEEPTENNE